MHQICSERGIEIRDGYLPSQGLGRRIPSQNVTRKVGDRWMAFRAISLTWTNSRLLRDPDRHDKSCIGHLEYDEV